jgi:hypothetical protein
MKVSVVSWSYARSGLRMRQEAAEKCPLKLQHRAPAAKAGPIFHRVTVCLKAYPDTNREFFRKLGRAAPHRNFPVALQDPRGRPLPFDKLSLGTADQDAGRENQCSAQRYLQGGGNGGRVHVAMANPGDDSELDEHYHEGNPKCQMETGKQER